MTEPATDSTVVEKTSKETVAVEQGQLLRAAEQDQCVLKVKTQRQRNIVGFTHSLLGVNGRAADDPHRRRQDARDSGLHVASFDHCDISAEVGMFNKKLKFKVLVSHRSGAVAAWEGPKDITEDTVRVVCDRLDEWRSGVCSLKGQNETAKIILLSTVDTSRRVKTIPRNTTRYSHDSLGHCESSIKEVEKQIRVFISHTWRADHQCDSDRHVAWTTTQLHSHR